MTAMRLPDLPLPALREPDLPRACDVFTQAFRHDPFFTYVMGGEDPEGRSAALLHAFTLRYGMKFGLVHTTSNAMEAVAVWLPPESTRMTAFRAIRAGVLGSLKIHAGSRRARRAIFQRMMAYGQYAGAMHKKLAPFPHWYLMAIGVADAYRGMGYAGKLLRPVLAYLDSRKLPCYLETHNPKNPPLYEHFGFKIVEQGRLPGTEQPHFAMLRSP